MVSLCSCVSDDFASLGSTVVEFLPLEVTVHWYNVDPLVCSDAYSEVST